MGIVKLAELVEYLNNHLKIAEVPDYPAAYNGLQVEGRAEVAKVAVAVDACEFAVKEAVSLGADMLLVHHGILWSDIRPITARTYRRLQPLLSKGVSVYSAHLPLDCHPELGNNAGLIRRMGLEPIGTFAPYQGVDIGWWTDADMDRNQLLAALQDAIGAPVRLIATGPALVKRVGVLSGGGGGGIAEAHKAGLDTLITGEMRHEHYFDAEELGINVLLGGHYATESIGVKLLAEHLEEQFGLETVFIQHPTGL
jgi:dinuclear metal center YbgI/SA1388 family protein